MRVFIQRGRAELGTPLHCRQARPGMNEDIITHGLMNGRNYARGLSNMSSYITSSGYLLVA